MAQPCSTLVLSEGFRLTRRWQAWQSRALLTGGCPYRSWPRWPWRCSKWRYPPIINIWQRNATEILCKLSICNENHLLYGCGSENDRKGYRIVPRWSIPYGSVWITSVLVWIGGMDRLGVLTVDPDMKFWAAAKWEKIICEWGISARQWVRLREATGGEN